MEGGKLTIRLHPVQKAQLRWRLRNHHGAQEAIFRRFVDVFNETHEKMGDEVILGLLQGTLRLMIHASQSE